MPQLEHIIDAAVEADHKEDFRAHLGGSQIGKPCEREGWYAFRWAAKGKFKGRMLRLFERGHKEEFRFIAFLTRVGIAVREVDPETKKQFRILDVDGHFGGSLDGIGLAGFPVVDRWGYTIPQNEEFLTEFKTHNTKSFCDLVVKRVKEAKIVHWEQMQIYMHKRGLRFALYLAVNKNDDDLYAEVVEYDPTAGPRLLEKAERIIRAKQPPKRIGNHPSWFECKFCEYAKICHYGEPMHKSCRSCVHSEPVAEGQWRCNKWAAIIPVDAIPVGCDGYKAITD